MAKSRGEGILHVCAIRLRVTGSGLFRLKLLSYDGAKSQTLNTLTLSSSTDIQPTKLANFKSQRVQIEFKVTAINETFVLHKIIPFVKIVGQSFPQ